VNFATEGPGILPENETYRAPGGFGHQWGMRGAAWVDAHVFSDGPRARPPGGDDAPAASLAANRFFLFLGGICLGARGP
jgi:hypothetical protein